MIKKDITFEDFDGNMVTETHYFHFMKKELIDMLAAEEDLAARLKKIGESDDRSLQIKIFTEFISGAYGERVDGDASKFFKSPEKTDAFVQSLAFDALIAEIMSDGMVAAEFVNGLFPRDIIRAAAAATAKEAQEKSTESVALPSSGEKLTFDEYKQLGPINRAQVREEQLPWFDREPTQAELTLMSHDQMIAAFRRKSDASANA